jgi:GAF domain-containing protein
VAEKRPVYCNDLLAEPEAGGDSAQEAIRRGCRSVIALPLLVEDSVVGSMGLYAREPGFFDDDEINLLTELADDISFALDHIGKEEKLATSRITTC